MEFGLDKCAKVTITRGKLGKGRTIKMPDGNDIKILDLDEQYKYLGLLESDNFESNRIKNKAKAEYKKRLQNIFAEQTSWQKSNPSHQHFCITCANLPSRSD